MTREEVNDIDQLAIGYLEKNQESNKLKETLSNVLLAYSKQRKEFNIPIKPEAIKVAEKLIKTL